MKVSAQKPFQPHFGNSMRQTMNAGKVVNRNYTEIFRNGKGFWKRTAKMLDERYPDGNLNITCYGCSEGSEQISLVISILEWTKNFAKNFTNPINAYDIDPVIIRQAKACVCNVFDETLYLISDIIKKHYSEYFTAVPRTDTNFEIGLMPKDIIRNRINYGVADAFEHVDTLGNVDNGILNCNFWNYLDPKKREPLAEKLHYKTLDNGFIIIGKYDERNGIPEILKHRHFEQSDYHPLIYFPY